MYHSGVSTPRRNDRLAVLSIKVSGVGFFRGLCHETVVRYPRLQHPAERSCAQVVTNQESKAQSPVLQDGFYRVIR